MKVVFLGRSDLDAKGAKKRKVRKGYKKP